MTPQINTIRRILAHTIIALLGLAIALNAAPLIAFAALSGMGFILAGINPADTAAALLFGCAGAIKFTYNEEPGILRAAAKILEDLARPTELGANVGAPIWNKDAMRDATYALLGIADRRDNGNSFMEHGGRDAARQRIRQEGNKFTESKARDLIEAVKYQRTAHTDKPQWWDAYIGEVQMWIDDNKSAA